MKRSGISDDHVLELARAWHDAPLGAKPPGVIAALMAEGIPHNLAIAKVLHMVDRKLLDYGVSEDFAWPR